MKTGRKIGTVVVRANAGPEIGSGHVVRSLALASAVASTRKLLVASHHSSFIESEALAAGIRAPGSAPTADITLKDLLALLAKEVRPWVILDGYIFDESYQEAIRNAGARLLVVDDDPGRLKKYHADLILDQNVGSESRRYPAVPSDRQLLGSRYALLRSAFRNSAPPTRRFEKAAYNWLLSFGGSDPGNVTAAAVMELRACKTPRRVAVVIGPDNAHATEVERLCADDARFSVERAADMRALMSWADAGLFAAGSTCLEAAYMGLPLLAIPTVENQRNNAAALESAGIARSLPLSAGVGEWAQAVEKLAADAPGRQRLSEAGQKSVDGQGAVRAAAALQALAGF